MDEQQELKQLASECYNESIALLYEGKLKNAVEMAQRSKEIYEEIGERKQVALTLNLLSIMYDGMGNMSMDLQCLLDALEIAVDEDAYDISAKIYVNLGSKLMHAHSYDRALFYSTQALEMFELANRSGLNREEDIHPFNLVLNMNLATICCYTGDFEKARIHYEIAKQESGHPLNTDNFFAFQAFEGLTLWKLGEKEKAVALSESIMSAAESNDYTTDYLEVISDFIELLKEMNDFDKWERILVLLSSKLKENAGAYVNVEISKRWLDFWKTSGNIEKYRDECVRFFELSGEKEQLDFAQRASTIELNTAMRNAIRHSRDTDRIVYVDPLTGIGNRNRMLEDSKTYIAESVKNHTSITIGLIDVDFFKECNDTYGHVYGDECLKTVARIIREAIGDHGNVYRYGGDEMLVLLTEMEVDEINEIGATIKANLEKAAVDNKRSPIKPYVTVSQGYTMAIAEKNDTIDTLVNLADKVLYSVKRYGRDNYKYMTLWELID